MPIYEYKCDDCGSKFEVLKRISENRNEKCPECNSKKVKRLISTGGFILKGSGWYVTDYPSDSRKKAMDSEKKATSTTTSDAPKKTKEKTKEKTETKKTNATAPVE